MRTVADTGTAIVRDDLSSTGGNRIRVAFGFTKCALIRLDASCASDEKLLSRAIGSVPAPKRSWFMNDYSGLKYLRVGDYS